MVFRLNSSFYQKYTFVSALFNRRTPKSICQQPLRKEKLPIYKAGQKLPNKRHTLEEVQ